MLHCFTNSTISIIGCARFLLGFNCAMMLKPGEMGIYLFKSLFVGQASGETEKWVDSFLKVPIRRSLHFSRHITTVKDIHIRP